MTEEKQRNEVNNVIRVSVVEDDEQAANLIEKYLNKYGADHRTDVKITHYCNAEMFLENYRSDFDMVFMDVELGGMNGIVAAKRLRKFDQTVLLMFVTNMPQYAVKGYEVNAIDYVIKPINYNSFSVKLDKAFGLLAKRNGCPIKIRVDDGVKIVQSSEVSYIEVMDHDVIFHTTEGVIVAYGNLSEREKQLSKHNFARCSACVLVNLKYVNGLYGDEVSVGKDRLRISRSRKKEFMKSLNEYLGGND